MVTTNAMNPWKHLWVGPQGTTPTAHASAGDGFPRTCLADAHRVKATRRRIRCARRAREIARSCAIVAATSAIGAARFDGARERVEPRQPVELLRVPELGGVERPPQHADRLVVDFSGTGNGWPSLPPCANEKRAGSSNRARRAVHDLGDQRQRLQRARAELLQQQERGEIAQLALVRERQHRAEPLHVHVGRRARRDGAGMHSRRASASVRSGSVAGDRQQRVLRRARRARSTRLRIVALRLADDRGVRLGDEVAHRRPSASDSGAPGRSPRSSPAARPPTRPSARHHERVQVNLEAVGDRVVVDARGQPAGAHQRLAVEARASATARSSSGVFARVPAAAAADVEAQLVRARIEPALERAHHRCRDAGGVPVHPHHAAERLEPERVAQPREQRRRGRSGGRRSRRSPVPSVVIRVGQPRRHAAAVQRQGRRCPSASRLHCTARPPASGRPRRAARRRDGPCPVSLASAARAAPRP